MAVMEQAEIQSLLPHRCPFLLVDRVQELEPDRRIVGIHCVDLVLGLGTLHCLSQQQPAWQGQGRGSR